MSDQWPLHPYQCRMLDTQFKVVETIDIECQTDNEAIEQSVERLRRRRDGPELAGFELRQGHGRVLIHLEDSNSDRVEGSSRATRRAQEGE
jgi:hypothetical protein